MNNFIPITSKDNQNIKLVYTLQNSAKARNENGVFVLEGLRICKDAFENNIKFQKLFITNQALEKHSEIIKKFSLNSNECYILSEQLFKKISDTSSPQGIIAVAKVPIFNEKISESGRYIALENISDPANLGAISRTAEALGVTGIILSKDSCDPYSPKSLRTSMGTLLRMKIHILTDFAKELQETNLKKYACVVDREAKSITEISFCDGVAVIIGNEANGITDETKNIADQCITIRMIGNAESLNAAVAASISMWEMMK